MIRADFSDSGRQSTNLDDERGSRRGRAPGHFPLTVDRRLDRNDGSLKDRDVESVGIDR
jgi:hypothetical protein